MIDNIHYHNEIVVPQFKFDQMTTQEIQNHLFLNFIFFEGGGVFAFVCVCECVSVWMCVRVWAWVQASTESSRKFAWIGIGVQLGTRDVIHHFSIERKYYLPST